MALSRKEKERAGVLEEFAKQKGLFYEKLDSYGVHAYFKDMKLFKYGGLPKSYNMMQRKREDFEKAGVFDYYYTVSTGKSSYTYRQTVYFTIHDELMLPAFRLFPEKWYHQISKWFGMQDMNSMLYPEFSKNYILQGEQPEFIWKLFQEEKLIDHFNAHIGWTIEAVGRYFIMYIPDKLHPVNEIDKFWKTGDALYALLLARTKEMELQLNSHNI
jgi:hypothetical protein